MLPRFRAYCFVLAAAVFCSGCAAAQVTVYRDRFGVPSVEAKRLSDALYGLGYATAQDHAVRMALNFKQARGRLAEAEGRSQLLTDGFIRQLGIEQMAEEKAKGLSGEMAELLQAYVDGANRALTEQRDRLPTWLERFTMTDVLALTQMVNAAFPLMSAARQLLPGMGSNQFAVGPGRSATGRPILSMDPHLPWDGILAWHEFAVYADGVQFRGITLPGLPFGAMGHNDRVAWCMTNNDPDLYDFFTVEVRQDDPTLYNYHGEWRKFETVSFELRYRDGEALKSMNQTARRTAWGPLVPFRPQAIALPFLGAWDLLEQGIAMARARTAGELREALSRRGLSMWNVVYADVQGNIGYQYNARLRKRDESFDWTKPVPGSDPRTRYGELFSLDELPRAENPKGGYLVNANSSPWLTSPDGDIPKSWPRYVTSHGQTTRWVRLNQLLSADSRITLDEARRYATDTLVPYALAAVRELRSAQRLGQEIPDVSGPLGILAAWNGRADTDSRGTALYLAWLLADSGMGELARRADSGEAWSSSEAVTALKALQKAAAEVKQRFGRLDPVWGEAHYFQRGSKTAPVSGFGAAPGGVETVAVVPNTGPVREGRVRAEVGSSFRMIVDLNPRGVRSWSILPYGSSTDPGNPHYSDQMELFGRGEYKDTHFGLRQTRKAAVSRITLTRP